MYGQTKLILLKFLGVGFSVVVLLLALSDNCSHNIARYFARAAVCQPPQLIFDTVHKAAHLRDAQKLLRWQAKEIKMK
jgi:hypothetical protein